MAEKRAWHEAYPLPRNQTPAAISPEDLLARIKRGDKAGVDFLLIDLRRTDHEVNLLHKNYWRYLSRAFSLTFST